MIFSTVSTFVEQVGRRQSSRYADLDQLICVYNGPTAQALQFMPTAGSSHPNYPLMFVTDAQVTNQAALITEITVTYLGIIQANGRNSYVTIPLLSISPVQGSRDNTVSLSWRASDPVYEQIGGAGGAVSPPGSVMIQPAFYSFGSRSITMRWIGESCSVRYQAYPQPNPPLFSGIGLGNCKWSIVSQTYGPINVAGTNMTAGYAEQQAAALGPGQVVWNFIEQYVGCSMQQKGKWFEVTEDYSPVLL